MLASEQRQALEAIVRTGKVEARIARRGQALLLMADGVGAEDIARVIGIHVRTVFEWRIRFKQADNPVDKLTDAPRSGRPVSLFRRATASKSSRSRAGGPST